MIVYNLIIYDMTDSCKGKLHLARLTPPAGKSSLLDPVHILHAEERTHLDYLKTASLDGHREMIKK